MNDTTMHRNFTTSHHNPVYSSSDCSLALSIYSICFYLVVEPLCLSLYWCDGAYVKTIQHHGQLHLTEFKEQKRHLSWLLPPSTSSSTSSSSTFLPSLFMEGGRRPEVTAGESPRRPGGSDAFST